jgi:DNA-binding transcriptional regulator YiaG
MRLSTKKRETQAGLGAALHIPQTERELTPAQQAVVDLRRALGLSQQKLATLMGKSIVTVARWETKRPPSGTSLYELLVFAERRGQKEIAKAFATVIGEAGNPQSPAWNDLDREVSFAAAIHNLSRNAHIRRAYNVYKKALERLVDAHALLVEAARDGTALHEDTPLDSLEYDQLMIERMRRDAEEK